MSMGSDAGVDLANKNDLMALFQVKTDAGLTLISTRAFDKYIKANK